MRRTRNSLVILLAFLAAGAQAVAGAGTLTLCLAECLACDVGGAADVEDGCCRSCDADPTPEPGPCGGESCPCLVVPSSGPVVREGDAADQRELLRIATLHGPVRSGAEAVPVDAHGVCSTRPPRPDGPPLAGAVVRTTILLI